MIADVEEQVKQQLKELFPRQFNNMSFDDIMTEIKDDNDNNNKRKGNTHSFAINLNDPTKIMKPILTNQSTDTPIMDPMMDFVPHDARKSNG